VVLPGHVLPCGHTIQELAPKDGLNEPGAHPIALLDPRSEYVPGGAGKPVT